MRLTIWYAAMLAAMLFIMVPSVHLLVRTSLREEITKEFIRSLDALQSVVQDSPDMLQFFDAHSTIDFFLIRRVPFTDPGNQTSAGAPAFSTTSTLPAAPPNAGLPAPETLAPAAPIVYESQRWHDESLDPTGNPFRSISQWPWSSPPARAFRFQTRKVNTRTGPYEIIVAKDSAPYERSLRRLTLYLTLASPIGLLMAGAGGYFLAARALSPVGEMARRAMQVNAERLSVRLPVENPNDEFGRLANAFNSTLSRLEDSFAQLELSNERLRRFTADASHEIRTPLTAIRTVGEVGLAEPYNPVACRDALSSMLEETDRLVSLVNDLMLLARGDVGAVPLTPEPIKLMELAENIVELLRVLAEEKSQELVLSGSSELAVVADRSTLRQAILNLVDNALRHTPAGGQVEVRVGKCAGGDTCIEVLDQGRGIPPEHREKIFDRFYRVTGEVKLDGQMSSGSGLGLSIAKWAAEANRAIIELETETGQGSLFRIRFKSADTLEFDPPSTLHPGAA